MKATDIGVEPDDIGVGPEDIGVEPDVRSGGDADDAEGTTRREPMLP